jgi:hypothetical protein
VQEGFGIVDKVAWAGAGRGEPGRVAAAEERHHGVDRFVRKPCRAKPITDLSRCVGPGWERKPRLEVGDNG